VTKETVMLFLIELKILMMKQGQNYIKDYIIILS